MAETEAILLSRFARTGDAEAFAEIIRRHAGLVYGAALRILADVDRASDVAQETFLQLTKDAHTVTGSLPGWLHRVATHKAIDQMRRDASRKRREAEYVAGQPREVTQWKDLSRYVDEELNKLDRETRDILVAHFLQGQTTRQIALVQSVSQATISRRIDTGVTRLRAMLRKRGILVAAGILGTLLGRNAVQAAPSTLMTELGKMALVGGHAAVGAAGASTLETVAGGVLIGVKAKVVAVAAVAVIGAGSIVTYQHATRPAASESTVMTRSPTPKMASRTVVSTPASSPQPRAPIPAVVPSDAAKRWNDLLIAGAGRAGKQENQSQQPPVSQPTADGVAGAAAVTPDALGGGMMGGFVAAEAPPQEDQPQQTPAPAMGGMYYSADGFSGLRTTAPPGEPNDSNDKSTDPK
jgi:RNA polymerase sigma factor (sigma-70 family)